MDIRTTKGRPSFGAGESAGFGQSSRIQLWLGILLLLMPLFAHGVTLQWDRNTEPSVVGYRAYCGTASRNYSTIKDVGTNVVASITNLIPGATYYFAVKAYTLDGVESDFSQEVTYTVPVPNTAPTAISDSYTTVKATALTVTAANGVLKNDTDADANTLTAILVANSANGSVALSANGGFTYTPNSAFVGTDSFTYRANDGITNSAIATVTISVTAPPNTAPVAAGDSYTTVKATALTMSAANGVLKNDTDADANPLTAILVANSANGSVALSANGGFTYTPNSTFTGTDTFTYRANDGITNSAIATVTISVTAPPNTAPVAAGDSYSTVKATALTVIAANGVLKNDTDADANTLTAILVANSANGSVALSANGGFTYTPNSTFTGTDTFTYRANDGITNSAIATVTISVTAPPNTAPVAAGDSYSTVKTTTLTVTAANGVLKNDTDADANPLTAVLANTTGNGSLALSANGGFTYTPNAAFVGTDTFTYRANDGTTNSPIATVTISVTAPPNTAPVAAGDSYTTVKATALTMSAANGVLKNDTDANADPLTAVLANTTGNGSLAFSANGGFTYTPNAAFVGTDTFTYRANDGTTNSATATVTINVTAPANTAPVAVVDSYTTVKATALTVAPANGVLKNDTDADADSLTAVLVNNPVNGSLNLSASGGFTYTPNSSFVGTDTFSYRANDGTTTSSVATVTISVTAPPNSAPVAIGDSYTTVKATALPAAAANGVLKNDTDADADPLTALLVSNPANGTLTFSGNGGFTYTPNAAFVGTDTFSYRASDSKATSAVATVTITVTAPPNSAPVAVADSFTTQEGAALTVISADGVLKNDTDADGDPLTVVPVSNPASGSLILGMSGGFNYTPNSGFVGTDTFSYRATDGKSTSSVAIVTIIVTAPTNTAPTAYGDSYATVKATSLNVSPEEGLLKNDTDPDEDLLIALLSVGPANGTLSLSTNGAFVYTPNASFLGTDTFAYRASDRKATSAVVYVSITVSAAPNNAPVSVGDLFTTTKATSLTVSAANGVLKNDSDADGDTLSAVLVTAPTSGALSLTAAGGFTYSPATNFIGTDTFSYRATDGQATSSVAVVTISVTAPPNATPIALADTYTTSKKTRLTTIASSGVLTNDSDADRDGLVAILATPPAHGSVTVEADGGFTFLPDPGFIGIDSFTYFAYDGHDLSAAATVTIIVNDVAAPVAKADSYKGGKKSTLQVTAQSGLLANDVAPEGTVLSAVLVSPTTQGTLALSADGSFAYSPGSDFVGVDAFTYSVTDGISMSAPVRVEITVETSANAACVDCFADLDNFLIANPAAFPRIATARLAMPTNGACLDAGLLTIGNIARAARRSTDPELIAAISSAVDCLASSIATRVGDQSEEQQVMLSSRWSNSASNQISRVRKVLTSANSATDVYAKARLLASLRKLLGRVDFYIAAGDVAPESLSNRTLECTLTVAGQKLTQVLQLDTDAFAARDLNGHLVATGSFTYRRDSWNQGTLTLSYNGVPRTEAVAITFSSTRWKLVGQQMRGYAIKK